SSLRRLSVAIPRSRRTSALELESGPAVLDPQLPRSRSRGRASRAGRRGKAWNSRRLQRGGPLVGVAKCRSLECDLRAEIGAARAARAPAELLELLFGCRESSFCLGSL